VAGELDSKRDAPGSPELSRGIALGDLAVALGLVAAGAFFAVSALGLENRGGYARVGPGVAPLVAGVALVVLGLVLAIQALRGRRGEPAAEEDADPNQPTEHRAMALIGAGLAATALLIDLLGFIASASLLFWLTARAFHSRHPLRDAIVAVVLTTVTFLVFTRGLGLTLPSGSLWGGR